MNQTAKLTIEFSGDLADSLRAIANLVEEHGNAFLSDPTAFFSIFNDGAVHRVDIDIAEESERCEHTGMTRDELESICGTDSQPAQITAIDREIKCGCCTLTALFNDGSTRALFSYYIDELTFSDADLIGLTAAEAHNLRAHRDLFNFYIDELAFVDCDLLGKTESEAIELKRARDVKYLQS